LTFYIVFWCLTALSTIFQLYRQTFIVDELKDCLSILFVHIGCVRFSPILPWGHLMSN